MFVVHCDPSILVYLMDTRVLAVRGRPPGQQSLSRGASTATRLTDLVNCIVFQLKFVLIGQTTAGEKLQQQQ